MHITAVFCVCNHWIHGTNARCVCVCYSDEVPNDLSGRLYHLEVMLKQLNNDLEKVRAFCFSL